MTEAETQSRFLARIYLKGAGTGRVGVDAQEVNNQLGQRHGQTPETTEVNSKVTVGLPGTEQAPCNSSEGNTERSETSFEQPGKQRLAQDEERSQSY